MALSIGGFSNSIYNFPGSTNAGKVPGDSSQTMGRLPGGIGENQHPGLTISGDSEGKNPLESGRSEETTKKAGRRSSPAECETCKNRKYVDGSDEGNVSYKSPTHIDPSAAAGAVANHEGMHVKNAYAKASKEGGRVLQASVSIHTAVCPECGRVYVSGGTTTTRIATPTDGGVSAVSGSAKKNPYSANEGALNSILNGGKSLNAAV